MLRLTLLLLVTSVLYAAAPKCPSRSDAEDQRKETVGYLVMGTALCSGTLVSPQVVLTAAHCLKGYQASDINFTLSPDLSAGYDSAPFAPAVELRVHPLFRIAGGSNPGGGDVALVKLGNKNYGKEPATFYTVSEDNDLINGATAYTLGYGVEPNGSVKIRRSRRVRFDERKDAYLKNGKLLKGGLFRFVRGDEGQIPCGGDSGSPILKFVGDRTVIVAVHSSAQAFIKSARQRASLERSPWKLCQASASAFSTNVGPFLDWIEQNRRQMEPDASHPRCP